MEVSVIYPGHPAGIVAAVHRGDQADLAKIRETSGAFGAVVAPGQRGEQQGGENPDDGDDHQ